MAKPLEQLEFTDNFMFCKVLTTHPDLCEELLRIILNKPVHILPIDSEHAIQITPDGKGIRLDVYLEDDFNVIYDLEMQTTSNKNLAKRSRYYQGMIDLDIMQKGEDYSKLKNSCIIFICTFDYFGERLPVYQFQPRCKDNPDLILDDGTVRYFLNPYTDSIEMSEELKHFLRFIVSKTATDDFTRRLQTEVETLKQDPKFGIEYMSFNAYIADSYHEGKLDTLCSLVIDQVITLSDAAARADKSEAELSQYMQEHFTAANK